MKTMKRQGVVLGAVVAMAGAAMAESQGWLKQTIDGASPVRLQGRPLGLRALGWQGEDARCFGFKM